jgi:hypothetical protein
MVDDLGIRSHPKFAEVSVGCDRLLNLQLASCRGIASDFFLVLQKEAKYMEEYSDFCDVD